MRASVLSAGSSTTVTECMAKSPRAGADEYHMRYTDMPLTLCGFRNADKTHAVIHALDLQRGPQMVWRSQASQGVEITVDVRRPRGT